MQKNYFIKLDFGKTTEFFSSLQLCSSCFNFLCMFCAAEDICLKPNFNQKGLNIELFLKKRLNLGVLEALLKLLPPAIVGFTPIPLICHATVDKFLPTPLLKANSLNDTVKLKAISACPDGILKTNIFRPMRRRHQCRKITTVRNKL